VFKFFRLSAILGSIAFLGACSGNAALEDRFAADPSLQGSPQVQTSPSPSPTTTAQLPADFPTAIPRYENAELVSVQTAPDNTAVQTRWTTNDPSNLVEIFYQEQLQGNNWQIITPFSGDGANSTLTARQGDLELSIAIVSTSPNTEYSVDYRSAGTPVASPSPTLSPSPVQTQNPVTFSDLDRVPATLQSNIQDLARLGVLSSNSGDRFNPSAPVTRRDFARWLVQANNTIHASVPGKQIRLGETTSNPAFGDVKSNDPDYAYIQGLAEAGLIPSGLSGDTSALLFRPNAPLTREDLIAWKVPLDIRKALPTATLDTIRGTWGFQDTAKINPKAARSLYADFQNADQANIRRIYGYTTLFQPKKPVTRAEAAAALWYFGFQGDGLSAADALQANASPSASPR
jgi:hypothetical protein